MEQAYLQELLEKLAQNRITADELALLMQVIQDDSHCEMLDHVLIQLQDLPIYAHLNDEDRSTQSYQKILSDKRFEQSRKHRHFHLARVAASIVLVTLGALLLYELPFNHDTIGASFATTWSAPLGEQRQIELPDGTSVWLNAGSTMHIADDYNQTDRQVVLTGEAYFDVQSDKEKPFSVATGPLITKVLGTAFNINTFDEEHVSVTVQKGKIAIQKQEETISLLSENQQLVYNIRTASKKLQEVRSASVIAWIHQRLRFDNVSMADAGKTLERWSNKTFVYRNEAIRECHFTVSFHEGENLKEMLNVISALNNFKYEIKNDTVYLDGNGCE